MQALDKEIAMLDEENRLAKEQLLQEQASKAYVLQEKISKSNT